MLINQLREEINYDHLSSGFLTLAALTTLRYCESFPIECSELNVIWLLSMLQVITPFLNIPTNVKGNSPIVGLLSFVM